MLDGPAFAHRIPANGDGGTFAQRRGEKIVRRRPEILSALRHGFVPENVMARYLDGDSKRAALRVGNVCHGFLHHRFNRPFVRSEEHTSELQSLMRISYAVFCLT